MESIELKFSINLQVVKKWFFLKEFWIYSKNLRSSSSSSSSKKLFEKNCSKKIVEQILDILNLREEKSFQSI